MNNDKEVERDRYEVRGQRFLTESELSFSEVSSASGSDSLSPIIRAPYKYYEDALKELLRPGLQVLELGAGMGEHTTTLVRSGASVTCLDIAPAALQALTRRFADESNKPVTVVGDIESIPLPSESMDVIACAGALSYGDACSVDQEIFRVLRAGGTFVCVDSLNHNWIYRLNRWRHYRRGARSPSTLHRMPTLSRIRSLTAPFVSVDIRFFGAMTWAVAATVPILGQELAAELSDWIDNAVGVHRSAFKFVVVAKGLRPDKITIP